MRLISGVVDALKNWLTVDDDGKVIKIEGCVEWRIAPTENGNYVGICDPLGITLQAGTWAAMMEEIGAVQNMLFRDLCETDELDQFLRDHGWRARGVPVANARFDLPFIPQLVDAAA